MTISRLVLAAILVMTVPAWPEDSGFLAGWQAVGERRYSDAQAAWVESAANGDVDVQYYLAQLHESGLLGTVDIERAIGWYGEAAHRNLPAALVALSRHMLEAKPPDTAAAIDLLTRAANLDFPRAQQSLASLYERGVHGAPQPNLAIHWYHLAARQGLPEAQYSLARLSAADTGNRASLEQALAWYHQASAAGLAQAENNLAHMYEQGLGVERDPERAVALYRRAADKGLAVAQNNLGIMLQYGRGTPVDLEGAAAAYGAAARSGHAFGQISFATCLANGTGIERNPVEAYAWLVAAARGDDRRARKVAREFMDSLESVLDSTELRRATLRASSLTGAPAEETHIRLPLPGALGGPVAAAQRYLALLGYLDGAVDNIAGPVTRASVKAFQEGNGLEADGMVSNELVTVLENAAMILLSPHPGE
ncbi:MAG: SEL1-like repeat protein [bacterium]|nr:SEL1-like repeat protein [bacterium]MDE0419208.1 SEL1-like repeat protein [bacterium]